MGTIKVRLVDDAHCQDFDKFEVGVRAYFCRKPKRVSPGVCDVCAAAIADEQPKCTRWHTPQMQCPGHAKIEFAKTGETQDMSDRAEHMQHVKDGHLEIVTSAPKKAAKE